MLNQDLAFSFVDDVDLVAEGVECCAVCGKPFPNEERPALRATSRVEGSMMEAAVVCSLVCGRKYHNARMMKLDNAAALTAGKAS